MDPEPLVGIATDKVFDDLGELCGVGDDVGLVTKTLQNGSVEIVLSGIRSGKNPEIGILNGQSFTIGFACLAESCWPGRYRCGRR